MDGVLLANNGPRGQSPVSSEDSDEFWENPPDYVLNPPVEAVVYGWGVNEDHQLGIDGVADVLVRIALTLPGP